MYSCPHYQHPQQHDTLFTTVEPILAHHQHPKSTVYTTVHSWCIIMGLDKRTMARSQHYGTKEHFRCLENPVFHLFTFSPTKS